MTHQAIQYQHLIREAYVLSIETEDRQPLDQIAESTGGTVTIDNLRGITFVDYPDGSGVTLFLSREVKARVHAPGEAGK